jgi:hypothetical protein
MTREPQEETEGNDAKQDTPTLKRESNEPENDKVKSAPIETIQNQSPARTNKIVDDQEV